MFSIDTKEIFIVKILWEVYGASPVFSFSKKIFNERILKILNFNVIVL